MEEGTLIRYTANQLGTMVSPSATRFEDHIVNRGDEGVYVGPHPHRDQPRMEDWHLTTVEVEGQTLYAPVHESHFEPIEAPSA